MARKLSAIQKRAAKSLRRKFGASSYAVNIRKYRHQVSVLKRKGILSPDIDARKVMPTKSLSSAITRAADVITGAVKPRKVSKKTAAKLRKKGVRVINERALVSPKYSVSGGTIRQKRWGDQVGTIPFRINNLNLGDQDHMRTQLAPIMGRMGKDWYVALDLSPNFGRLWRGDEIEQFLSYLQGGGSFNNREKQMNFGLVYVPSGEPADTYMRDKHARRFERDAEIRAADRERIEQRKRQQKAARERRKSRKTGTRTTRGK